MADVWGSGRGGGGGGCGTKGMVLRILLGEEGMSVRQFRHRQLADALLDRRAFGAALWELGAHLAPGLACLLRLAGLLRGDAEEPQRDEILRIRCQHARQPGFEHRRHLLATSEERRVGKAGVVRGDPGGRRSLKKKK